MTAMLSEWIDLPVSGPFDLGASARFLEGFTPAGRQSYVDKGGGSLRLAFPASPSWRPVGAVVRQCEPDGPVQVRLTASPADVPAAVGHVRRILSLDVDGAGFPELARRDRVIRELQAGLPGLRPVLFHSPYEAACWSILSQRVRMTQAATLKDQIARRVGVKVAVPAGAAELSGIQLDAFPAPRRLLELDHVPLVADVKNRRLRGVAEAALEGQLDAAYLRSIPAADALRELAQLPGIGTFSAELILLRGAGHPDVFATAEPRLHKAVTTAYGLTSPSVTDLERVAEDWKPYRTWVSVLFRARGEMAALPA
ncbi:DNA-3-methyladenine glycosylase II [Kibdelosporangium banguiense]|uniref:DNA-3-methyladenine glycosylase II n=1 Tax=Kibdelosporangium banguiense TaxID=1365924 RepID=A0ABS4TNK6_9PSEU|nr:DNA-3-methyladenine glycosylase 2 family protein [Kibdelosporangium banguiense]MBP2325584.1 DNA-3-methyladenine glycosylase II [Kibdelosporangium banguiense]